MTWALIETMIETMNEINLFSALLIGLAGGLHCIGMCSGIAAALRFATPEQDNHWPYTLSYNAGRIISYTLFGALAGTLGQLSVMSLPHALPLLKLTSGILLLAMAAYLGRWWLGLRKLEQLGGKVWRRIQPLSKRFIPFRHPVAALPYGMIWGWLPCGLVYSALSWSMVSGDARQGALIMLCFGLGTLPALLAASIGASWLVSALKSNGLRQTVAGLLAIYAVLLLATLFVSHLQNMPVQHH